jgi:hypothetical protein
MIKDMRDKLAAGGLDPCVRCVAVAGSIGRMEAYPGTSDADLIVILHDAAESEQGSPKAAYDSVWKALPTSADVDAGDSNTIIFKKPKYEGVFGKPTSQREILDETTVGDAAEGVEVFAKRLLLLLESQPLFHDEEYDQIVNAIVDSYAHDYVARDPHKEWAFLINDLIRYFRQISVH